MRAVDKRNRDYADALFGASRALLPPPAQRSSADWRAARALTARAARTRLVRCWQPEGDTWAAFAAAQNQRPTQLREASTTLLNWLDAHRASSYDVPISFRFAVDTVEDTVIALPDWLREVREIIVDEAQDLTTLDWALVLGLAHRLKGRVVAAGDYDQAIARFRGADPELFARFARGRGPESAAWDHLPLGANFRCPPDLVRAAATVVTPCLNRPRLVPTSGRPEAAFTFSRRQVVNTRVESQQVAATVAAWIKEGTPPSEIAIFVRVNAQRGPLEAALIREGVPYRALGHGLNETRACRVLQGWLRSAKTGDPAVLLGWLPELPGYTRKRVDAAISTGRGEADVLRSARLPRAKPPGAHAIQTALERAQESLRGGNAVGAAEELLLLLTEEHTGTGAEPPDESPLGEELTGLIELIGSLEPGEEDDPIRPFLRWVRRAEEAQQTHEAVTLATVHRQKGQEYARVVIVGGSHFWPHLRAASPLTQDDERRLFYVALTRAREEVAIIAADQSIYTSRRRGGVGGQEPSLYLAEMAVGGQS